MGLGLRGGKGMYFGGVGEGIWGDRSMNYESLFFLLYFLYMLFGRLLDSHNETTDSQLL